MSPFTSERGHWISKLKIDTLGGAAIANPVRARSLRAAVLEWLAATAVKITLGAAVIQFGQDAVTVVLDNIRLGTPAWCGPARRKRRNGTVP